MSLLSGPVSVKVPASSGNLGPGFDAFGLALSLYDELVVEVTGDDLVIDVEGEGAHSVPRDESHLVVQAMQKAFDLFNLSPGGLHLRCLNRIPHSRGLGSSSAAIVSGIAAARTLAGEHASDFSDQDAYQLAADLEGHPDNVAASQFGGFTIAWIDGGAAWVHRLDTQVPVSVFVPAGAVSTHAARNLLPEQIGHADAAANSGRAALLVAALTSAPELLFPATQDRLHQSFRAEAMPDSYRLVRTLRLDEIPAVISGAGPTVLAFASGLEDRTPEGWIHHALTVDPAGVTVSR